MSSSWFMVVAFACALLALGWRWRGEAAQGDSFWTAGRQLSGASVGLSISAGFMSVSWSCVYAVQLFYWYGLGGLWLITVPWLVALLGIYWLSGRYHALAAFSQPEMIGDRFGVATRRVVALPLVFVFLVWGGAEIYVAAKLLAPGLGLSTTALVIGIGAVVAAYSMLGGLRAVVATDKMQYVLVGLYVLLVAVLAGRALRAQGGSMWPPAALTAARTGLGWTDLLAPGLATILVTFCAYLPGWLFETDLWVRVQAARDLASARRGMAIALVNSALFVGLFPLFIGVAALALFPLEGGLPPPILGADGDAIFAAILTRYAPAWLASLAGVGLIAAALSTIDTCANVTALAVGYDVLGLDQHPNGVAASRWVMAGALLASCLFALNIESLWNIFYLSSGVLSTAVAFPVAAVFWPGAKALGVRLSSLFGFLATFVGYFLEQRGMLAGLEGEALAQTGLGYIAFGALAALVGYGVGAAVGRFEAPLPDGGS